MLGDWFQRKILYRGLDYYKNHRVKRIVQVDNGYLATVDGSEDYEVFIEVNDNDEVVSMTCNCPYAKKGYYCKHEAAVLFEIYSEEEVIDDENPYEYDDEYDEDEEEYEYDYGYRHYHIDYDDYSESTTHDYDDHPLLSKLESRDKKKILRILEKAVEDEHVYQVIESLITENEAYEKAKNVIEHELSSYTQIRNLKRIPQTIDNLNVYNQPKHNAVLVSYAIKQALKNIQDMNNEERSFVFEMLERLEKAYRNNIAVEVIQGYITEICVHNDHPITYDIILELYQKNYSLDVILKELESQTKLYSTNKELLRKYLFVVKNCFPSLLDEVIEKNYSNIYFKYILLDDYMNDQKYRDAIKVCLDAIKQKEDFDLYLKLIELDQLTNQTEQLIRLYRKILYYKKPGSIEYYLKLKELYTPAQWNGEKMRIIHKLEKLDIKIIDIYLEEEMYDRLLNYFMKNNDMYTIKRYESLLFKHKRSQMIKLYEDYIYKSLIHTGTREFYRGITHYLKVIARYDKVKATKIYNDLTLKYNNRPAMISELHCF